MKDKIYIGIDAGKSGAMAVMLPNGKIKTYKYKAEEGYAEAVRKVYRYAQKESLKLVALIEQLTGFQGGAKAGSYAMTSSQAFQMGRTFGKVEGYLEILEIPIYRVTPKKWENSLGGLSGLKGQDRKRKLCQIAKERFPELKPTLETCDAILLVEYASNTLR